MRSATTTNHHDRGLFEVGLDASRPPRGGTGLYHLAWEVPTMRDLAAAAQALGKLGALSGASDHGVSKSLCGAETDGNEFEIMWQVPAASWGEYAEHSVVQPLNLKAELARWG